MFGGNAGMRMLAIIFIIISSTEVGFMCELRKSYQVKNGVGVIPTALFMMITNAFPMITGVVFSQTITWSLTNTMYAVAFAFVALITGILCLIGSAWGNVSILVACALLGKLVLPSVYGMIVLPEENVITVYRIIGFLFAFVALALNFVTTEKEKSSKNSVKFKSACIVVFFTQGLALIIISIVARKGIDGNGFVTTYMAVSTLVIGLVLVITMIKKPMDFKDKVRKTLSRKSFLIMLLYAVLIYTSDRLGIACAGIVPLIFQAPVSFCVPIIVVAIMDFIIYREKLNKKQYVQLVSALLCCICFMV